MKRQAVALILALAAACASGLEAPIAGKVEYLEGTATLSRDGGDPVALDFASIIRSGDLVKTEPGSRLVIALDKATGFAGSLTINAASAFYIDMGALKGEAQTVVDLITGSLGAKVKKVAGSPSMLVQTATATAGVRGTEFEVATSINDALFLTCSEGEVSCEDESGSVTLVAAGKALEKRGAERPRFLGLDPAEFKGYGARWVQAELEAFLKDPLKVIKAYESRYRALSESFHGAFDRLQKQPALAAWTAEDREGKPPLPRDPAVRRQVRELLGTFKELRHDVFLFERVMARMDEIRGAIEGTPREALELRPGVTLGDYFRRFDAEKALLQKRIGLFHYAQRLFAQRDDGSSGLLTAPPPRKESHL